MDMNMWIIIILICIFDIAALVWGEIRNARIEAEREEEEYRMIHPMTMCDKPITPSDPTPPRIQTKETR